MEDRSAKAVELHHKGYNCSQAVVCAYADVFGIDEKTAFSISESFGAGMGGMESTCGALSGMLMLNGLSKSSGELAEKPTKAATYKAAKELAELFKDKVGSSICKEIKGLTGSSVLRSCDGCIEDACKIISEKF